MQPQWATPQEPRLYDVSRKTHRTCYVVYLNPSKFTGYYALKSNNYGISKIAPVCLRISEVSSKISAALKWAISNNFFRAIVFNPRFAPSSGTFVMGLWILFISTARVCNVSAISVLSELRSVYSDPTWPCQNFS